MKKVKIQLAVALLCGVAAMTSSCKSHSGASGCYYSATEAEIQQKRISSEVSHTDYAVHSKINVTAE